MACIYLLNSRGSPQSFDFVITTYSYPLLIERTHPILINLVSSPISKDTSPKVYGRSLYESPLCLANMLRFTLISLKNYDNIWVSY